MESIISQANVCRLAFCDGVVPYVVPLCFGYCQGAIYFHAAKEGRKLEILSKNSKVCFEIDIDQELILSQDHCSMRYRSVIGFGTASNCGGKRREGTGFRPDNAPLSSRAFSLFRGDS
jgi:nitroimidazol reductase NimA-like FMN-containing flavoprotein (pyridoxamine 5'-phosphate oxidase superfamily)